MEKANYKKYLYITILMKKWKVLLVCMLVVFLAALVGSLFTSGNTESQWYLDNRPSFTPPNWVFAPVWTVLYLLIAFSLYLSWIKTKERKKLIVIYGVNLFANVLWSYLFFELRNPLLAFLDLLVIFASIPVMMYISERKWLLVPYLLWVTFAGVLNLMFLL